MISLGYRIPKPEIVSRIERGEEPCSEYCRKTKLPESQPEGGTVGSKDSEPVIKTEPLSPTICEPPRPVEISSSQERSSRLQCQACGTYCNNQCGMNYQWNPQRLYHAPPGDGNQGKPYVAPPPPYFNGNPSSHCFVSRGDGMSHPTSPSYGNVVMNPLSPHYTGYRTVAEPISPYALNERMGNPMFGTYESSHQAPLNSAGSSVANAEQENRNRREHFMRENAHAMHPQNAPFQDRRSAVVPCPGCGTFCNNQCGASLQWEQKRPHQVPPHVLDGNRFVSPSNPYFNGNTALPHLQNGRPGIRHCTPTGTTQGNVGMIQLSPHYTAYRRPSDPKSPNVLPPRSENSSGATSMPSCTIGGNGGGVPTYVQSQGNRNATFPNGGNPRRSQTMSPLAAIETMPVFSGNGSPSVHNEQRMRHPSPAVTSSDGSRERGTVPKQYQNTARRPDHWRHSGQGNPSLGRSVQQIGQSQANNGKPAYHKTGEAVRDKSPSTTVIPNSQLARNAKQSPSPITSQESSRVVVTASLCDVGVKRVGPPITSDSALPVKRASPPIIIIDSLEETDNPSQNNAINSQSTARSTPPNSKLGNPISASAMPSGSQDTRKTQLENKDGKLVKRPPPPITISSIRSAGVFIPPAYKAKNIASNLSSPVIIIDDKESSESSSLVNNTNEIRSFTIGTPLGTNVKPGCPPTFTNFRAGGTPPVTNVKPGGTPPATNFRAGGTPPVTAKPAGTPPITIVRPGGTPPVTAGGTPPVTNNITGGTPPVSSGATSFLSKMQTQSVAQGSPVVVNNLQMQQSSNIIVAGNPGLGNSTLPGNQNIVLTFPVTVGSSGIMLATPVNFADNQGMKPINRVPISKNPRLVQTNTIPLNPRPGNGNAKFAPVAMTSIIGPKVSSPSGQAKPITIGVNPQTTSLARNLNFKNTEVQKVNTGGLKSVPVTASGNQPVGQAIPLFVDANSRFILTAPSKDSSGIGNATVVTVNGNVVGGKLAFRNLTPVNVNGGLGIGNTTIFTVDRSLGIGNAAPVALSSNATAVHNKGTLNVNNPQVLTVNNAVGLGNAGTVGSVNSVNPSSVSQTSSAKFLSFDQQSSGIIIRKVGDSSPQSKIPQTLANTEHQTVMVDRLFKCNRCEERFSSLENVTAHQKVHEDTNSTVQNCDDGHAKESSETDGSGGADGSSPTILYTTQGDDGSTVYVVTV
ncbi:mucin-17-like isoform X2 [Pelobates fuscus]